MKKKILYSILIIALIVLLLCITGCSTSKNDNVEQTDSNITSEENFADVEDINSIYLNTELSNMVSVALNVEDNATNNGFDYTVYAINQDGTDIELLQESTNNLKIAYNEDIDYFGGKIYLVEVDLQTYTSIIYNIDLTLGNGNYSLEEVATVENMDIISFSMFNDEKAYIGAFNKISKTYTLESYDLGTGEFETIDTSLADGFCKYDKENKYVAYNAKSETTYCIKTYNTETKEITTIYTGEGQTTVSDANDGYVIYRTYDTKLYLYDIETRENATLIGTGSSATIIDGNVFYTELEEYTYEPTDEPEGEPISLNVYEDGEITKLRDYEDTGGYDYLLDLGTGKWQIRWSVGTPDDSLTWTEQWYIIDPETYEFTTNDKGYNAIHVVADSENEK